MGWRGRGARWVLVAGVVGLCACRPDGPGAGDAETPEDAASGADTAVDAADAVEPLEPSLFAEGCPVPGRATARLIESDLTRMDGPDAIGRTGDYLLMNEEAAFIIEAPERANAYYYYGGILVDAVAVEACRQAGPERFGELGIMMGVLKLDLVSSVLRAFRGTAAEVLSDGTDGGPAVVRVTGHDDRFWLVELELIRQAVSQGGAGSLSEPLGLDITVDYILESGSPVLRVEVTYRNLLDQTLHLLSGAEAQFGDTATPRYFAGSRLEMAGFGLEQDVPWMSTSQGDGAWAIALAGGTLATVNISGVTALVDGSSLESGSGLAPAGTPGDSRTVTFFVSVGPFDANSAVAPLQAVTPSPLPGVSWEAVPVEGAVLDEATGDPLAGAVVDLQAQDGEGEWQPLDSFVTRADGTFSGLAPFLGDAIPLRLAVALPGRPEPEPVPFDPDTPMPVELPVPAGGILRYLVLDGEGAPIPAKITLFPQGQDPRRLYGGETAREAELLPGSYQVAVTRGYEYTTFYGPLVVEAGLVTDLEVTLERVVDTSGWMSVDTHCHAAPSADSVIPVPHRIVTVAGEGVDVVVSTDHEFVADWSSGVAESGLTRWVATVVGQEVTATLPEHVNMFPVEPWNHVDARGGFVHWYGMDLAGVYAAIRERGASIVSLNHPRSGYLDLIGYDSVHGEPLLQDPTVLGFPPDAELWSWDFNAIELMNGPRVIFRNPPGALAGALFDDWMGFHNLGHRIVALGSSDTHGEEGPGEVRTYFASPTDDPVSFDGQDLVDALVAGRAVVSAGAFIRLTAGGQAGPGDMIGAGGGTVDVAIRVEAPPAVDVAYVTVFRNCDQVASVLATDPHGVVKLDVTVPVAVTQDSHVVVAAFGAETMPPGLVQYSPAGRPRGVTNPVFVDHDGDGAFTPPGVKSCVYDLTPPDA